MIGYDNIGDSFLNILPAFHLNEHGSRESVDPGPDYAAEVAANTLVNQGGYQYSDDPEKYCVYSDKGNEDYPFIWLIQNM